MSPRARRETGRERSSLMGAIHESGETRSHGETCVLLAGGAGRRLERVTAGGNKHLLEIDGRPALGYVIEAIVATRSVDRLVVVTRPDSSRSIEELLTQARRDVEVVVRVQAHPTGTLDAVMTAWSEIEDRRSFAVHYGDNLFAWRELPPFRQALREDAMACVYTVDPPEDWRRYGAVRTIGGADDGSLVAGLTEKPSSDDGPFRSLTGFFRFDTRAFLDAARKVGISPRGESELTGAVEAMLMDGPVRSIHLRMPWTDFGTERGLRAAPGVIAARGLATA